METHEYCKMFPEMDDAAFSELCISVAKHGIRQPVFVHRGKIVDGRHRERAGLLLGCEIPYVEWGGGDDEAALIEFVADCNLNRRDLTTGQRAAVAVEIKQRLEAEYVKRRNAGKKIEAKPSDEPSGTNSQRSTSRSEAAQKAGVNERYVSEAARIQKQSPDLFEAVKRGTTTIPEAKRRLGAEKPVQAKPAESWSLPPVSSTSKSNTTESTVLSLISEPSGDAPKANRQRHGKKFGRAIKQYDTSLGKLYLVEQEDGSRWVKSLDVGLDRPIQRDEDGETVLAAIGVMQDIRFGIHRIDGDLGDDMQINDLLKIRDSINKIVDSLVPSDPDDGKQPDHEATK